MKLKKSSIHWRLASDEAFCGRSGMLDQIEKGLGHGDSFAVIGQRGTGKSMLMRQVLDRRGDRNGFDPLCFRVSFSGQEASAFEVIEMVRDQLAIALARNDEKNRRRIVKSISKGLSPTKERPILSMIQAAESLTNQPVSLDLLLDDFHRLCEKPWIKDLLANLEHELFSSRIHARYFRAVFAGDFRMKDSLENMPFSDLWHYLRDIWLCPLSKSEVKELLSRIEHKKAPEDLECLAELIGSWAGGHPSLTQYLLRDLLDGPSLDPEELLKSSASRFLEELGKMIEVSWGSLEKDSKALIQELIAIGEPIAGSEIRKRLAMNRREYTLSKRGVIASGFVGVDGEMLLPPGRVFVKWLRLLSSQTAVGGKVEPHLSLKEYSCSDFPTILHLTDLHFGKEGHAWYDPAEIPGVGRPPHDRITLIQTLIDDLKTLRVQNKGLWPRVVIVSGDILFRSNKEGIKQAVEFLERLSDELQIERTSLVLCPGNHEQNRKVFLEEPKAQLASYCEIWNSFYPSNYKHLPLEWSPGGYTNLYRVENMEILSLDSCEDLDPEPNKDGTPVKEQGYVSKKQLNIAKDLLVNEKPADGIIRVAVLHHHLSQHLWTSGVDYSILREVERVIEWLRRFHFDFVFHGHQHCVGLNTRVVEDRYLTILAGGSAGIAAKHRFKGGMPITYQLVCSVGGNYGVRICRIFDLLDEVWVESPHYKPTRIPIGFLSPL